MTEKTVQRRNKPTVNINQENLINATKKRKAQQQQQRKRSSLSEYLLKPIYLIISLAILGCLYLFFTKLIYVEYTNVPINLPKLVNNSISERFWGTYR